MFFFKDWVKYSIEGLQFFMAAHLKNKRDSLLQNVKEYICMIPILYLLI